MVLSQLKELVLLKLKAKSVIENSHKANSLVV